MKQVIRIGEEPKEEKVLKPIEFTHYMKSDKGFVKARGLPSEYQKVVYLGKDKINGDLFAAYIINEVVIYKGHLNDGVY